MDQSFGQHRPSQWLFRAFSKATTDQIAPRPADIPVAGPNSIRIGIMPLPLWHSTLSYFRFIVTVFSSV